MPGNSSATGLCIAAFLLSASVCAAQSGYPEIQSLSSNDVLFQQQQDDIERYYRRTRAGGELGPLTIYRFRVQEESSLISLAARFSLPYSTLATLNRLQDSAIPDDVGYLLIPNMPGLFVPYQPQNELERLMTDVRSPTEGSRDVTVQMPTGTANFHFHPGESFDRVERLSFLNILFKRPLENVEISSHFGTRRSPISGQRSFHAGVDFPADVGAPVLASRDGTVLDVGTDRRYGHYVLLEHSGGFTTFYSHMDTTEVELNQRITSGTIVGRVGMSGLSTGPHLHFEIRIDGEAQDPVQYLPGLHR